MHRKYAPDGLVAVSVSIDDIHDPMDPKTRERVVAFLEKKQATLTNLLLDESSDTWSEKFKIGVPGCVFVFDRDNRLAAKFEVKAIDYDKIEELVRDLLKKK
jgi:hypothetical protein